MSESERDQNRFVSFPPSRSLSLSHTHLVASARAGDVSSWSPTVVAAWPKRASSMAERRRKIGRSFCPEEVLCGAFTFFSRRPFSRRRPMPATSTSPKFNTCRPLQPLSCEQERRLCPLCTYVVATGEETSFEAESQARIQFLVLFGRRRHRSLSLSLSLSLSSTF